MPAKIQKTAHSRKLDPREKNACTVMINSKLLFSDLQPRDHGMESKATMSSSGDSLILSIALPTGKFPSTLQHPILANTSPNPQITTKAKNWKTTFTDRFTMMQ